MDKNIKNNSLEGFDQVLHLVVQAKDKVWQQINKTLINLYWSIGEYIYVKMLDGKWGKSTVENLSSYLLSQDSSSKGFS